MTHVQALRPMGLLEIIDQTFRLYRANFWLFFGIAAIVYMPLALLQSASVETQIIAGLLTLPAYLLVTGALTKAVSDRYMGDEATFGGSYRHIGRRLIPFILTALATSVFVASGFILLIVGVIVFAFWATFVTEVFIIEDKRYFSAIWRSKFLIGQGVWAQVLVLGLITGLIGGVVQMVIMLPVFIAQDVMGANVPFMWIAEGVLSGISQTLAVPIGLVASILLYYDSRIRKEGFDLEVLARELGRESPAQPPPPAPPQAPPTTPSQWPPAPPPEPPTEGGGGV